MDIIWIYKENNYRYIKLIFLLYRIIGQRGANYLYTRKNEWQINKFDDSYRKIH